MTLYAILRHHVAKIHQDIKLVDFKVSHLALKVTLIYDVVMTVFVANFVAEIPKTQP